MKITIDIKNNTIEILDPITLNELNDFLKNHLKDSGKDWLIISRYQNSFVPVHYNHELKSNERPTYNPFTTYCDTSYNWKFQPNPNVVDTKKY